MAPSPLQLLHRILDANANRASEGVRVAEELARLVLEDSGLARKIKALRHGIAGLEAGLGDPALWKSREVATDPGRKSYSGMEKRRKTWEELGRANWRRAQEALRVLEEVSKLISHSVSLQCKQLRFQSYALEQEFLEKHEKKMMSGKSRR